jgi:type I restriction enzyme S subunit
MTGAFAQLGSVAEFINGAAFRPDDWGDSGVQIIRIQNLTDPTKPFNRTERAVPKRVRVQPGDLLVSWSATLGVFEWVGPEEALLNQHIFRVLPDDRKIDKRYLRHALEGALIDMRRHLHGATMQHVNRGEFLGTELFLPSLTEQQRIAEILDRARALRAQRHTAVAQLDPLIQAVFVDLFRDKNHVGVESLGEHLLLITSGGRGWAEFCAPSGSRFVRSFDVQMNRIGNEDIAFVNPPNNAEAARTRVKSGDVLLRAREWRSRPVNAVPCAV